MLKLIGSKNCSPCLKLKQLLDIENISYEYFDVEKNWSKIKDIQNDLGFNIPSIPFLLCENKNYHIGSFSDLDSLKEFLNAQE